MQINLQCFKVENHWFLRAFEDLGVVMGRKTNERIFGIYAFVMIMMISPFGKDVPNDCDLESRSLLSNRKDLNGEQLQSNHVGTVWCPNFSLYSMRSALCYRLTCSISTRSKCVSDRA